MRPLFLLLFLFAGYHGSAQCCCADHLVEIRTPRPAHQAGNWNYSAELRGDGAPSYWHMDSVPGDAHRLTLRLPTGCGLGHMTWSIMEKSAGEAMRVNLYDLPGDSYLPRIVLPFAPGSSLHFSLREILLCVTGHGGRWSTFSTDSVRCGNGGRARYTYDAHHGDRFEPENVGAWMMPPGKAGPEGAPLADAFAHLEPLQPRSGAPVSVRFTWTDGSCGRYQHSVEVLHRPNGAEVTEILIGLGLEGPNCDDITRVSRVVELPPLGPGKYRIRIGLPPNGTTSVLGLGGWREFEVLP